MLGSNRKDGTVPLGKQQENGRAPCRVGRPYRLKMHRGLCHSDACRGRVWVLHSRGVSRRSFEGRQSMNRRISIVAIVLIVAGGFLRNAAGFLPHPSTARPPKKQRGWAATARAAARERRPST